MKFFKTPDPIFAAVNGIIAVSGLLALAISCELIDAHDVNRLGKSFGRLEFMTMLIVAGGAFGYKFFYENPVNAQHQLGFA